MSCLIVHTNLWRDGLILGATTEAAQFSAEYTQDDSPQLFWRSTAIDVEQTIEMDLGSDKEYDFVALIGHNLTDAATIEIHGADDDAFTTNVVEDALTWNGNSLYGILDAARTKRYIRIAITDAANPSGFLQVGTVVVGKGNALNRSQSAQFQRGYLNETEVERSPSAAIFTVSERPSLAVQALTFTGLDDAAEAVVETLLEKCGTHRAWAICLDSATPNDSSSWVHLLAIATPACSHPGYWTWTAEIEEIA